jgi:single-stranded-DNA-specific exonuclease
MNAIPPTPPALGVTRSVTGRRWIWRGGEERTALLLAQRTGVSEVVGRLLAARNIGADDAADFLSPTLRALLPDPSVLTDMDTAASRLARAIQTGETVAVFGDYDVDGACSAAVITLLLRGFGCPVLTHVPDRLLEGYGPNAPALRALAVQGATLVVCVDCGTAAAGPLATLEGLADVLVLDHHKAEGPPPPVFATVNPNRLDDGSGLHGLCAAAVAFLAAVATVRTLRRAGWFATRPEPDLRALLDLVALATVCDVMPLVGVNRALVTQGLKVMGRRDRPGIAALLEVAAAKDHLSAATLGWALGPRINAAGRIDDSGLGLRLLLTDDPVEARALATKLDAVNRDRQELEAAVLDDAHAHAHAQADAGRAVLLVHGDGWHPGVVGIIAGRIKQRQNRPALAGALADGIVRGSGRSVTGVDLGAAVLAARREGLLTTGGGHAMAAGFSLRIGHLDDFHAFLEDRLAHAAALPRTPDLIVEATVAVAGAGVELAQQIARLSPFGAGNEEPIVALPRARVVRAEWIGRDGATLRVIAEGEGGQGRVKAMLFRAAETPLGQSLATPGAPLHLAGHVRAEEWNGTTTACFVVSDAAAVG